MVEVGTRIRFISTSDPYSQMPSGTEGTVSLIDSMGTVHVNWDDGGTLGMVKGQDRYEVINGD